MKTCLTDNLNKLLNTPLGLHLYYLKAQVLAVISAYCT